MLSSTVKTLCTKFGNNAHSCLLALPVLKRVHLVHASNFWFVCYHAVTNVARYQRHQTLPFVALQFIAMKICTLPLLK